MEKRLYLDEGCVDENEGGEEKVGDQFFLALKGHLLISQRGVGLEACGF